MRYVSINSALGAGGGLLIFGKKTIYRFLTKEENLKLAQIILYFFNLNVKIFLLIFINLLKRNKYIVK